VFRLAEGEFSDDEWDEAVKRLEKRRYTFWAQLSDAMALEQVIAQVEVDTDAKGKE
jgi:adenosyl cobinamide kinase/adenosyl cobinamide phosphate guanylyltransferase